MIQLHRFFFLLLEKRSTKTTQSDSYAPVIHPGMNSLSKLKFPGLPAVTHGLIDTSCSCTPLVQVSVLWFSQILTQPKTKQRVQICKKKRILVMMYNAHIVHYYHPGVTRHQSENTRIFLPGPSKGQLCHTPITSLKLWTIFALAWRTIRDPFYL